ncbi:hypothetical protein [Buchnera aphidicola]|uniref:Peptidoglycan hydrolase FlgJ, partial n=1 Tax=Buchnera aphidicola subsp. Tuberolachnus salignus TaxID=98804 RepID=A0A160SY96_BUCTT|nr:hypothetical protein [Buchnera aphidicola]CUR53204.1 Peptidoglycan hydrolase FlgJ [Buchnera aphidicola (Tuberolachnus salignus)]
MTTFKYLQINNKKKIFKKNFLIQKNKISVANLKKIASQIQTIFVKIMLQSINNSNKNLNPQINPDNYNLFYTDMCINCLSKQLSQKDLGFLKIIQQQIIDSNNYLKNS